MSIPVLEKQPLEAIFRPVLVLMSGRSLGFVAAFAIPLILARVFDQAEFGTYKQLFLILGTLFGITQLGMAESLYFFLPYEKQHSGRFVINTMLVMAAAGSVSLLLLSSLRERIAGLLNNSGLADLLPYIGFSLVLLLVAVVLEIVMTVRKQHVQASLAYGVSDLLRAAFYLIPVLLVGTLQSLLLGAVLFALARVLITLVYISREYGRELYPDFGILRKHLAYALPFGLAGLIEVMQLNYHMYAVSFYFDAATFAVYAVGCLQLPLIDILMTSTSNVMMVNMREKIRAGATDEVLRIWLDSVRKLALILCPLVGVLLVVAHELIILLFTDTYAASVPVFMAWTLGMLLVILLSDSVLRVFADNRFLILQNLLRLGVIILLIPWFLERFELIGAVLVTIVATLLVKVMALIRIKTLMEATLAQLLPWRSLLGVGVLTVLAAVPALLVKALLTGLGDMPPAIPILMAGFMYVVSYYFLLLWRGPMTGNEKNLLINWSQAPYIRLLRLLK